MIRLEKETQELEKKAKLYEKLGDCGEALMYEGAFDLFERCAEKSKQPYRDIYIHCAADVARKTGILEVASAYYATCGYDLGVAEVSGELGLVDKAIKFYDKAVEGCAKRMFDFLDFSEKRGFSDCIEETSDPDKDRFVRVLEKAVKFADKQGLSSKVKELHEKREEYLKTRTKKLLAAKDR